MSTERVETVVVGGGQAGLAVGYHLKRSGRPFVILDASARVGDAWRTRWDSLRLFTPRRWAGLPGLRLPGTPGRFPTKDELADYLEAYVRRFQLPVRSGTRVESLRREGERFVLRAGDQRLEADQVVVAMADYQRPRTPAFAAGLRPGIVQLHARDYRSPAQLPPGPVLVVGVGNSGGEIALELARGRTTWLSGRETGHVPFRIDGPGGRLLGIRLVRFVGHRVLTLGTPLGRKVRPRLLHGGSPLVRVGPAALDAAAVRRVPRDTGVQEGLPLLADGGVLEPAAVVWATGYSPGFEWIELPVLEPDGRPRHHRGVVDEAPGLYFVGLHFQYAMSSATLVGVDRDARYVVRALLTRARALREAAPPSAQRAAEGAAA